MSPYPVVTPPEGQWVLHPWHCPSLGAQEVPVDGVGLVGYDLLPKVKGCSSIERHALDPLLDLDGSPLGHSTGPSLLPVS